MNRHASDKRRLRFINRWRDIDGTGRHESDSDVNEESALRDAERPSGLFKRPPTATHRATATFARNLSVQMDNAGQPVKTLFAELHVRWIMLWLVIAPLGMRFLSRTSLYSSDIAIAVFYAVIVGWIAMKWRLFRGHSWQPLAIADGRAVILGGMAGLSFAIGVTSLGIFALALNRSLAPLRTIQIGEASVMQWALTCVMLVVFVPITEELLFRGILLNRLRIVLGGAAGVWVPALAFALLHGSFFFEALLFALLLSYLYLRSAELWSAIAAHAVNNASTIVWQHWGWPFAVRFVARSSEVRSLTWCLLPLVVAGIGLLGTTWLLGRPSGNGEVFESAIGN